MGRTSNLKFGMKELAQISFPTMDYNCLRFLGSYIPTHFFIDLSAST
jgi:hypothetical protein